MPAAEFHGESLPDAGQLTLHLESLLGARSCECPVVSIEACTADTSKTTGKDGADGDTIAITADISPLQDTIENCKTERWRAYLTIRSGSADGGEKTWPLIDPDYKKPTGGKGKKKDIFRRGFEYIKDVAGRTAIDGKTIEAVPNSVRLGIWVISVGELCNRYMYAVKCVGTDYRIKNHRLCFKITCPDVKGITWKGIMLEYRYRFDEDRCEYYFPASVSAGNDGTFKAAAEADITGLDLKPINWDVRMVFEKDGEEFRCHLLSPESEKVRGKRMDGGLQGLFAAQSVQISDGYQLSFARTDKDNTTLIVQENTPYAGFWFRLKERIALLIYRLFRKSLKKKNIFLVFEKYCSMAQDNGYFFFRYCMENDMEKVMGRSIYYVIDKSQNDYRKLEPYKDHVLHFMSIKHMVYLLAARLLISSDSRKHGCAWRSTESVIRKIVLKEKKSVFLQHGVFGLKKSNEFLQGTGGGTDLFIASNEMEKGFIMDYMGYKPEQVAVTGLARWDVLKDKSADMQKKWILVMPTWRKWLEDTTDEIFLESEYYHKYMELINSEKLAALLEKHDLWVDFYVHPKISEQIRKFTSGSDRVRLIPFGSEPLNELMMDCSLLITDYSSVCWDVYYMEKPVIFYQFDLERYNEAQGAYMDLEKDLFGDRAKTEAELMDLIEEAAEGGFKLKPEYGEMREGLFAYIDHDNSKRTCEEIMKRGW